VSEEEFQQLADEIEAIDAYVKRLLTPQEMERRRREIEAAVHERNQAGPAPMSSSAPAPDLIPRPSTDGVDSRP